MSEHSVGTWDESHESEASQAAMFCFDNAFQKSLASLSIWSLCFALPMCFCVPECHRNRVKSPTAEKVFFFSVSLFASGGKPKRRRQGVHDRWMNCLCSGWKILENAWAITFSSRSIVIWLNAFTGFNDGAVQFHSLGYCTVVFVSCNSVWVDANANNFFLWERGYYSRGAFL